MVHHPATYLRPLLAALFLLAGVTVLSQQAHCLGMTLEAAATHAAYHATHGTAHKDAGSHETHTCDHESNASAKADWMAPTGGTQSLLKSPILTGKSYWPGAQSDQTNHKRLNTLSLSPPPAPQASTDKSEALRLTGRLLI